MSNNDGKQASVNKGISKWHVLAFGAPYIGVSFFMDSIGVIQGVYAKYYGIALTSLAIVLLISRIFDAVTDPLIGCFSDSYRARKGTRKPFVCVGGLCLIPCSYFLFVPSGDVSVMYFATWSLLFYLASTINMIPTYAWCSEISSESGERTALFSVLVFFGRVAGLVFYLVPFLPIFETTEITPETLKVSVLVGAALLLPGLYCSLRFAPDGPSRVPAVKTTESLSKNEVFRDLYDAVKGNKPFQIYMAAYFCTVLGLGMYGGLFISMSMLFWGRALLMRSWLF